jgi:hypothetical protein
MTFGKMIPVDEMIVGETSVGEIIVYEMIVGKMNQTPLYCN